MSALHIYPPGIHSLDARGKSSTVNVMAALIQQSPDIAAQRVVLQKLSAESIRLHSEGKYEQAKIVTEELLKKIILIDGDPLRIARCEHNLGHVLNSLGRFQEARQCIERSLPARRQENSAAGRLEYAKALHDLGILYERLGDVSRAILAHTEAADVVLAVEGDGSTNYASSLSLLSGALIQSRQYAVAAEKLARAIAILRAKLNHDSRRLATSLFKMGITQSRRMQFVEARESFLEALLILDRKPIPELRREVELELAWT